MHFIDFIVRFIDYLVVLLCISKTPRLMKKSLLLKIYIFSVLLALAAGKAFSQVGINTTSPQPGSILDVESTDKGMLVPRVNITNMNNISPITGGATESLLVYNTNNSTGRGFYYWNGLMWEPLEGDDWDTDGNSGINPAIDFIGTTDNVGLPFRTNNIERLEITNDGRLMVNSSGTAVLPVLGWDSDTDTGMFHAATDAMGLTTGGTERFRIPSVNQVHAMARGTTAAPFYSWNADTDTGMWSSQDDYLNFSSGGLEFVALQEGGNDALVVNETGVDMDTRIETNNQANALFVDGANDNIGLGTASPDTSAQLDLGDNDKGILINRVALTGTTSAAPITGPANGLMVYNTASSNVGNANEVTPGFYYWNGGAWNRVEGWSTTGNAGTNSTNNFLGTTDYTTLVFRTDNSPRMYVDQAGTVGIGNTPFTNVGLRVNNAAQPYGVLSQTTSASGVALYGEDTGSGGLGIYGTSANNHGIFGITSYTGSSFLIGGIIGWGSGSNGANGVLAVADQTASTRSNMGIRAISGSTTSISSNEILNVGVNSNATDLAIYALSEGPITSLGEMEAARFQTNYTGDAVNADTRDPRAELAGYTNNSQQGGGNMYYGGYFYSGGSNSNSSWAYAGARYNNTNYKIIGNGNVSTIVEGATRGSSKKVMFAPEAPEVLFEDYGTGQLVNGRADIQIDPIFANNIQVDRQHPLKVFIQLEGDCNGTYVTNKSKDGFTVVELKQGKSNVNFSWHIVANRKDEVSDSGERVVHSSLRFPDAPSPKEIKDQRESSVEQVKPEFNQE